MGTQTKPADGALILVEMKEFGSFTAATQRYIRRSLDVGLGRRDAIKRWSRECHAPIPDEIIDRPKKGFGMPIAEWIRGPLNDMAHDLLSQPKLRREGFLDPMEVHRLLDEHERGIADRRKPLWTLLAFELWIERFGPGTQSSAVAEQESAVIARAVG